MIREIKKSDLPDLREMMQVEGFGEDEMGFINNATWVLDEGGPIGFYSIRMEHGIPYLVNFCISRSARCHSKAVRLARAFKNTIRSFGFYKAIFGIRKDNDYLKQIASRYFRAVPYSADDELQFYLMEVSHG